MMARQKNSDVDVTEILSEIRKDPRYRKFKAILQRTQGQLDLDKDRTEALSLHASRTSRKLYGDRQYSVKALIDASLRDLSFRSRMVEIRVIVQRRVSYLKEAVN